jgi:hypothetical protein
MGEQPVHFWGQVATSVPISTGVDSSTQATKVVVAFRPKGDW